jgi:hypothetical protein
MFMHAKRVGLPILALVAVALLAAETRAQSSPGATAPQNPTSSVPLYLAGTTVGPGPGLVTQGYCCCCCCCYYYYPTVAQTAPVTTPPMTSSPTGSYTKTPTGTYTKTPAAGYTKTPASGHTKPSTGSSHPSSPGHASGSQPKFTPSLSLNPLMARNFYAQAAGASARANLSAALASLYGANSRAAAGLASPSGVPSENPYAGYLRGNADLIDAEGKYRDSKEEAHRLRAYASLQQAETQRRAFDQYLYEKDNTPTRKDEQERSQRHELRRSQNDPPVTEVCSSKALNDLLDHLQGLQARGAGGEPIVLGDGLLKRIKVSAGKNVIGVLQDGGRLDWPPELRKDAYRTERAELERLAPVAIREAVNGRVATETLRELRSAHDRLTKRLTAGTADIPPRRYIEAKRFVNDLGEALKVLGQADAGDYFTGKYTVRGKTVQELVKHMTERGLRFAPAMAADEAAYVALHRALAACDASAQAQLVAQR